MNFFIDESYGITYIGANTPAMANGEVIYVFSKRKSDTMTVQMDGGTVTNLAKLGKQAGYYCWNYIPNTVIFPNLTPVVFDFRMDGAPSSMLPISITVTPSPVNININDPLSLATYVANEINPINIQVGTVTTLPTGTQANVNLTVTPITEVITGYFNYLYNFDFDIPEGPAGPMNNFTIGTVTTEPAGTQVTVTVTGTAPNYVLNFGIPQGEQGLTGNTGPAGPANTLAIGTVSTLPAGGTATATITGTAPNQTLNLGLVTGDTGAIGPTGPANTLTIGTVTTVPTGGTATATITGTAPNQTLNLGIVTGANGESFLISQGPYANATALQTALPASATYRGIASTVGTATPYDIYICQTPDNGATWSWVNNGPIQGPQGPQGATGNTGNAGPANTLAIGTVTTVPEGGTATATITGTAPNQTLNLGIVTGATGATGATGNTGNTGPANTLAIGTVTTVAVGGNATATIIGTAPNQTLNLGIPTGATGANGTNGQGVPTGGTAGQVLSKTDGTDYNTQWVNAPSPLSSMTSGQVAIAGSATTVTSSKGLVTDATLSNSSLIATALYINNNINNILYNYGNNVT